MPRRDPYPLTMPSLPTHVRRLGGVAETRELTELGFDPRHLAAAVHSGDLLRIRRGWYATPDIDPALRTAIRIGGRLACVSAAARHGWAVPEQHGVHVCVAENAARMHRRRDAATSAATWPVEVHWGSARRRDLRNRLVTDRYETVMHLVGCLEPEVAVAILDSFLHREPVLSRELETWLGELPAHVRARLPTRNALCHSYLESIGRIRLEGAGLTGEHQVDIPGVGRVDMVIDGRVVIEWDGGTHRTADQQHEDCRRDALLTTMGYRTLRFSYRLVMDEWYLVIAAVRAALDEVGCVH
jgi:very-short-patch-repair endonuclease